METPIFAAKMCYLNHTYLTVLRTKNRQHNVIIFMTSVVMLSCILFCPFCHSPNMLFGLFSLFLTYYYSADIFAAAREEK